jgi:hypothetical protein
MRTQCLLLSRNSVFIWNSGFRDSEAYCSFFTQIHEDTHTHTHTHTHVCLFFTKLIKVTGPSIGIKDYLPNLLLGLPISLLICQFQGKRLSCPYKSQHRVIQRVWRYSSTTFHLDPRRKWPVSLSSRLLRLRVFWVSADLDTVPLLPIGIGAPTVQNGSSPYTQWTSPFLTELIT